MKYYVYEYIVHTATADRVLSAQCVNLSASVGVDQRLFSPIKHVQSAFVSHEMSEQCGMIFLLILM